jgi:ribulose 1,5-bisphosphate synthetase/thiazole synthase
MRVFRCLAAAFAAVLWAAAALHAANLACDVAIIGGGPGGVHTAYKLTTQHLTPGPVCLFEMKDHLGGRVGDNVKNGILRPAVRQQRR